MLIVLANDSQIKHIWMVSRNKSNHLFLNLEESEQLKISGLGLQSNSTHPFHALSLHSW